MVGTLSISVRNQSGQARRYAVFAEAPRVSGRGNVQVWSVVVDSSTVPNGGYYELNIDSQYAAFSGSTQGPAQDGVTVSISSTVPVTLGTVNPDGSMMPGSTLPFTAADGYPQFEPASRRSGTVGAFSIKTNGSVDSRDARNENYFIGLAGSFNGPQTRAIAGFVPQPNVDYQIQPSTVYYVTMGDYRTGQLISARGMEDRTCKVDFSQLGTKVTVVQNEMGELTVRR